jgi:Cys-rich protein (TIGR01571 family)
VFYLSDWRNGFCDCFGSCSDCLIGYFCPCIHAYMAAKSAEQGTIMGALNCFFYPCLVPLMRYQAREKRGIDVRWAVFRL